jgi:signal transduction histidine kinase
MQPCPSAITVRIDPELGFHPGESPVFAVPFEQVGADVVVAQGDRAPPRIAGEAVVRVGEATADGWSEVPVEVAVSAEEFHRDGAAVAVRARTRRLALRPRVSDDPAAWLDAVRVLVGADHVRVIGPDDPAPSLARLVRATRAGTVAVASAAELADRFGPGLAGTDALYARALGPREEDGVLLIGVADHGATWLARTASLAGAVLEAAVLRRAEQRIREVEHRAEETAGMVCRLLGIAGHDLSNLLFAANLGVATVQRKEPSPVVDNIGRTIAGVVELLRRTIDTGTELLGDTPPAPGTAELRSVFVRVRDELGRRHPERLLGGTVPEVEVAVSEAVLERLLIPVLSNAILHADGPGEVTVGGSVVGDAVVVEVRNPGHLPFADLERLAPFEHRSKGYLGTGLWAARRLASAMSGVTLSVSPEVTPQGEGVKAVLRLPIESIADNRP